LVTWSAHQGACAYQFHGNIRRVTSKKWSWALYLTTEDTLMVRTPDPRMIRHRGDQVAPRNQFVAFDGDAVVDCPAAPWKLLVK
jgi:hypothetical protein